MNPFDFGITAPAPISTSFRAKQINSFGNACLYVQALPYGRNADKHDLASVFADQCGTCSTKHALLRQLAIENAAEEVRLKLCIFKMSKDNTPRLRDILETYGLDYIPEAHNYLRINGDILDCTGNNFSIGHLLSDVLTEIDIQPCQITDFKVTFHKGILEKWLEEHPEINLSPEDVWHIREACIVALAGRGLSSSRRPAAHGNAFWLRQ